MRHLLFVFSGIIISFHVRSQDTLRGKITDASSGEALPGVTVFCKRSVSVSDPEGHFFLCGRLDTIHFRLTGYTPIRQIFSTKIQKIALHPSPTTVSEIVVTASKYLQHREEVPLAIEKITAGVIADTRASSLSELINKSSGVVMLNLNNEQHGMSIRQPMGTSPYYLYMEDGIPLRTMGVFNHNALIEMNMLSVSSIEVVKGPASSLYGPEAVGGAINFISMKPSAQLRVKAGLQADNFGYRRAEFNAGGPLGKKTGFTLGGYSAAQNNGWMTYSDFNKTAMNARVDHSFSSKTRLVVSSAYQEYNSETPGTTDSTAFYSREYNSAAQFTYRRVNSLRVRSSLIHEWNADQHSTFTAFYRNSSIAQNPAYAIRWTRGSNTAKGEINNNTYNAKGLSMQHVSNFRRLKTRLISGISTEIAPVNYLAYQVDLAVKLRPDQTSAGEYTILNERPENRLSHYRADLYNSAIYAQAEIRPVSRLNIVGGLRFDDMRFSYLNYLSGGAGKKVFNKLTPKLGATYKFNNYFSVYGNASQGFSPPALTSVFSIKPGTDHTAFYYDLEPATFENYECGAWINAMKNKLTANFALYHMQGKNELLNVRQPDNSSLYQSAGKTVHKGIEYSVVLHPSQVWMVRAGGSNSVHRYDQFEISERAADVVKNVNGKIMPSAPAQILNAEVMLKPRFFKGFRIALEWQHLSSWYTNQVNTQRYADRGAFGLSGVSVLHLRTGYQAGAFELYFNVQNLSNELYAHNVSSANNPDSQLSYTPAAPRTFIFGVQYQFISKK